MDIRGLILEARDLGQPVTVGDLSFELWLEFEYWVPTEDDDPEDDFINMYIQLSTGKHYALNVWTFKFLERSRLYDEQHGDNLSGKYALPPDLFVQRLDRGLLEEIVVDLIRHNRLQDTWLVPLQEESELEAT